MEENADTKLTVVNEDGNPVTIDVIDVFNLDNDETQYIIYSIDDNVYASILYDDGETIELQTITDPEDYTKVMSRVRELIEMV